MSVHDLKVPPAAEPPGAKVQTPQPLQEDALRRLLESELGEPFPSAAIGGPIVWAYDLEEVVSRLRRIEIEVLLGQAHQVPVEVAADAASHVFQAVQDHLEPFFRADQTVPDRLHVWRLQTLAKEALFDYTGSCATVRRAQEKAVGERPLTICIGRTHRSGNAIAFSVRSGRARAVEERAQLMRAQGRSTSIASWRPHGDGCGSVHHESRALSVLYARYCAQCDTGNRQRAFERKVLAIEAAREADYELDRCACGNALELTRPNVRTCRDCQRLHRARTACRESPLN